MPLITLYTNPDGLLRINHFAPEKRLARWVNGFVMEIVGDHMRYKEVLQTDTETIDAAPVGKVEDFPGGRNPIETIDVVYAETEEEFVMRITDIQIIKGRVRDKNGNTHGGDSLPTRRADVIVSNESDLPTDKHFRAAWTARSDGVITIPMDKARLAQRERIREKLRRASNILDAQSITAITTHMVHPSAESQLELERIEALRERLRTATEHPDINSAVTLAELKVAGMDIFDEIGA